MTVWTPVADLPTPRLQLRWELFDGESAFNAKWACHYELVMPLGQYDVRREVYDDDGEELPERTQLVVPMKTPTLRGGGGKAPCYAMDGTHHVDAPYRDGAHAMWDSKALGGLPIYVVDLDGLGALDEQKEFADA